LKSFYNCSSPRECSRRRVHEQSVAAECLLLFYQQQLVYNSVAAMALSSRVQWMQQQQQQQWWWTRAWCHVWEWSQLGMHQTPKRIVEMLALIRVLAQLNFRAWVTSMVVAVCIHIWLQQIIKPPAAVTYSCSGSCTMTICSNTFP
jgi:muconolactone delta-isomerase